MRPLRKLKLGSAGGPRPQFWLGFVLGVGALVAVAVSAVLASTGSSQQPTMPVVPAAPSMRIFAAARTSSDVLPTKFARLVADFTPPSSVAEDLDPGAPSQEDSRLLLSDLGTNNGSLYALPTKKGQVCFIFTGGPVGGCIPAFGGQLAVPYSLLDPDQYYSGQGTELFGLAPDSVKSIGVIVSGDEQPAKLAKGGFFFQVQTPTGFPSALVVRYHDGQVATVTVSPPPPPTPG